MISKTKIVIAFILFLIPSSIFAADWVKTSVNKSGDVFYYDKESLKIVGKEVFFLRLTDYVEPSPWGDLSSVHYDKFHCELGTVTYLAQSYYSLPMGNGEKTNSSNINKTKKLDLNSNNIVNYFYELFCNDEFLQNN